MWAGRKANSPGRFLSKEGAALLRTRLLPPGSVAVSCIGWQMGRSVMTSRPSFTNQQLNAIVPHEGVDGEFLYYALRTRQEELLSLGSATGVRTPIINKSAFGNLTLLVPSIGIQKRIASTLSAYDDLIDNNLRRIKILEEMAQSLYREWFVDFRFPGHESAKMVDSPLGMIPEGWETTFLRDVADVNASSVRRGCEPEEIEYVDISSVAPGRVEKTEAMLFIDAPSRARRLVAHGDVIWSAVRPNRRSFALILDPLPNMLCSTGFAVLTARRVPFSFLYAAVTTDEFVGYLTSRATGAAYPAVNASVFEEANLLVPDDSLLRDFHRLAEPTRLMQHDLVKRSRVLLKTRDLLLPKLISGELDVSELDIGAGEDAA
jgi:type I restriction enzyme, S subunit